MYRPQAAPAPASRRPARSLAASFAKLSTSHTTSPSSTPSPKKTTVTTTPPVRKTEVRKPVNSGDSKKPAVPAGPPQPGLVSCSNCGRYFEPSRIATHQNICQKTANKKRKPFDPVKHRLEGTEAQAYVNKRQPSNQAKPKAKKTSWRTQHNELIMTVRAAREAQAHVARGGKLSDLPPPPALTTEHLIPCPHCNRKFNDAAAERHIPKCANIRSRPKPPAGTSKSPKTSGKAASPRAAAQTTSVRSTASRPTRRP